MGNAKIVVLTGAGISAESGLGTFRDSGGLWERYPVEQVATPEGFKANPALVHDFYNQRRAALKTVKPNAAHKALARLERALVKSGGRLTLVTQNVDDLHERAGSHNIIHMHGRLKSLKCSQCLKQWHSEADSTVSSICPQCQTRSSVRPGIVWFGEMPYHLEEIDDAIVDCDLFVSIGTSGAVYPAAGYVQTARGLGKQTLEINLEPSQGSGFFDETRLGKAGELVPIWVNEILEAQ